MDCLGTHLPLSSFRQVELIYLNGATTTHLVHESQVEALAKASLELHYEPGINPETKGKAAELAKIIVRDFQGAGPYWWSTPGLNDDPAIGARIFSATTYSFYWIHPSLQEGHQALMDALAD